MIPLPHLSIQVVNFAAEAPDDWKRLLNHAMAADRAGVDRIAVSDHVVFGAANNPGLAGWPNRPDSSSDGNPAGRTPTTGSAGQVCGNPRCPLWRPS